MRKNPKLATCRIIHQYNCLSLGVFICSHSHSLLHSRSLIVVVMLTIHILHPSGPVFHSRADYNNSNMYFSFSRSSSYAASNNKKQQWKKYLYHTDTLGENVKASVPGLHSQVWDKRNNFVLRMRSQRRIIGAIESPTFPLNDQTILVKAHAVLTEQMKKTMNGWLTVHELTACCQLGWQVEKSTLGWSYMMW